MSFRLEVNGKKLKLGFVVRVSETGSPFSYGVEVVRATKKGLEPDCLSQIGIGLEEYLEDNPEAYRLGEGEFYLRDYDNPELVNKLVEEGWIEPVIEANPLRSGYVNFWVYRLSTKALEYTQKVSV